MKLDRSDYHKYVLPDTTRDVLFYLKAYAEAEDPYLAGWCIGYWDNVDNEWVTSYGNSYARSKVAFWIELPPRLEKEK